VVENKGLDFKSLSGDPTRWCMNSLAEFIFSIRRAAIKESKRSNRRDLPATRPHFEKVGDKYCNCNFAGGRPRVFEARGEILTVPARRAISAI